jgi:hypothetical protein
VISLSAIQLALLSERTYAVLARAPLHSPPEGDHAGEMAAVRRTRAADEGDRDRLGLGRVHDDHELRDGDEGQDDVRVGT